MDIYPERKSFLLAGIAQWVYARLINERLQLHIQYLADSILWRAT